MGTITDFFPIVSLNEISAQIEKNYVDNKNNIEESRFFLYIYDLVRDKSIPPRLIKVAPVDQKLLISKAIFRIKIF